MQWRVDRIEVSLRAITRRQHVKRMRAAREFVAGISELDISLIMPEVERRLSKHGDRLTPPAGFRGSPGAREPQELTKSAAFESIATPCIG
ncbi:MAG: hypothetical protein CMN73_04455 [Sphingomonas sp.]|nr:hypothetical protein [Sphingomonas sp.]